MTILSSFLETVSHIKKLYLCIKSNNLTDQGWSSLTYALMKQKKLISLSLILHSSKVSKAVYVLIGGLLGSLKTSDVYIDLSFEMKNKDKDALRSILMASPYGRDWAVGLMNDKLAAK